MWRWICEDEEEALGFAMVFERAGIPVQTVTAGAGETALETSPECEPRAAALQQRLLQSYARRVADDRGRALDRREAWGRRTLVAGGLLVAIVVLLAL